MTDLRQPGSERRTARRRRLASPLAGNSREMGELLLIDASDRGVLVEARSPVDANALVMIEFARTGQTDPVQFSARLVHATRVSAAKGPAYVMGLEFVPALRPDQKQHLASVLAHHLTD